MHYPRARTAEWRGGVVGTERCDHTIFGNVAARVGEEALGPPATRPRRSRPYDVGSQQQVIGILSDQSTAAARRTVASSGRAHVHRVGRINTAIFQDPNVRRDRCGVKLHRNSVRAGTGSRNVLGVIN